MSHPPERIRHQPRLLSDGRRSCELWLREALDGPGVSFSADRKRRLTPPAWTNPP